MKKAFAVTGQFRRDVERLRKHGKNLGKLREIMKSIAEGKRLEPRLCDHKLLGEWGGHRECHIGPDWLLIYCLGPEEIIFERTGSHADLFE